MILAIDIGNTNIVAGCGEGKTVSMTLDKNSVLFADQSAFDDQLISEEAE